MSLEEFAFRIQQQKENCDIYVNALKRRVCPTVIYSIHGQNVEPICNITNQLNLLII